MCGGDGNPEKDSQLPGHKVAATLLEDVWLRQGYYFHHFGVGHTSVYPGIQGYDASDQRTAAKVGRRRWDKPIQVSASGILQTPSNHLPPTPPLYHTNPTTTQAQTSEAGVGTLTTGGGY